MKINLKMKILAISILPILLLGIVTITITLTIVKDSLIYETQESLKGTSAATLAAYEQNSGEYMMSSNGDVWKGSYNVSKSESLVDNIANSSGMDVTFFYGDKRIMTSVKDSEGNRVLGSPAGETIVEKVLNNGEEYFSNAVSLEGTLNYGYFIPVYQKNTDTSPIGMIFVGTDKEAKDDAVNRIIYLVIASVGAIMMVCGIAATVLAFSITGSLKKSINAVQSVAAGELGVQINEQLLLRKDEIGDLSKAINFLKKELTSILKQIIDNTNKLSISSDDLKAESQNTNITMQQVEIAVNAISDNANEQAIDTKNVSDHIIVIGEEISETSMVAEALGGNAEIMRKSSNQAAQTIQKLRIINNDVEDSINIIAAQTNQTNDSVQKIREATELIADIAEESNLLSLNASIEAARAGESGRGFAVVAAQIQKLAVQSSESSYIIEQIVNILINDSNETVNKMQHVKEIIDMQSSNMEDTEKIVGELMNGIENSLSSIEKIEKSTNKLDSSRNQIVKAVEDLNDIAQENASSAQETSSKTIIVTNSSKKIEEESEELKELADTIADTMKHFHM